MILGMIGAAVAPVLARLAAPLAFAGGVALALAGAALWDCLVDDPAVAAAARRGYVLTVERDAAEAELAETRRQLTVAREARDRFAIGLAQAQAASAAHAEKLETEIAAYETELVAAGRACRLDRDDVEWLHRP